MTRRLTASLHANFGPILKCQVLSPVWMRMARTCQNCQKVLAYSGLHAPPRVGQNLLTILVCHLSLANDSQACRESARLVLDHSKMPSSFQSVDMHDLCVRMRSTESGPRLCHNFSLRSRLANDSQACFWADSKMPSSFPSLDGLARACVCAPLKGGQKL